MSDRRAAAAKARFNGPGPNSVQVEAVVDLPAESLMLLSPEQRSALMEGVAKLMNATAKQAGE